MAQPPRIAIPSPRLEAFAADQPSILLRTAAPEHEQLLDVLCARYPNAEWATFARFGWRETPMGLVITLAALDLPAPGDLDSEVAHVAIQEPYTVRIARLADTHPLAVGVIHSHPEGYRTAPSRIDDDMDAYFADYFADFAPDRPYVSVIFARDPDGSIRASGRAFWNGRWWPISRVLSPMGAVHVDAHRRPDVRPVALARLARLVSSFGVEAAQRLANATVAVIGVSGTGMPAVERLARAGVGHLIVVDPDHFTASNFERLPGTTVADLPVDGQQGALKVDLARRLVHSINPDCQVTAIHGRLPQEEVLDAVVHADVVLGCTDQQHSRVAQSELATRYLVPVLDVGVNLEGGDGQITGLIEQYTRFLPADACVWCRAMVDARRVTQELLSPAEQETRRAQAANARARGDAADAYWLDVPLLHTVGFLTGVVGMRAAGYAIGWITGRFAPPFTRLQLNAAAPWFDVTDQTDEHAPPRATCDCRQMRGLGARGLEWSWLAVPSHWSPAVVNGGATTT